MKYLGGKERLAPEISKILKKIGPPEDVKGYIEPFCGFLGILKYMIPFGYKKYYAFDYNADLIELLKEIKNGTFKIPDIQITKEEYEYYRKHTTSSPNAMRAYVGIIYSYAGGWFNTYYPVSKRGQDFVKNGNTSINKLMSNSALKNVTFKAMDYKDLLKKNYKKFLIYCDPPYIDTQTRYNNKKFDYDKFWDTMRILSKDNIVVISETKAPEDFVCIWSKKVSRSVNKNSVSVRYERLFVHYSFALRFLSKSRS